RRSDVGPTCLAWNADGLYACADASRAGFSLGLSRDDATTFEPRLRFDRLCGTSACGAETDVGRLCPSEWASVAPLLGATCVGAGPDAGRDDGAARPPEIGGDASGGCSAARGHAGRTPWHVLALVA